MDEKKIPQIVKLVTGETLIGLVVAQASGKQFTLTAPFQFINVATANGEAYVLTDFNTFGMFDGIILQESSVVHRIHANHFIAEIYDRYRAIQPIRNANIYRQTENLIQILENAVDKQTEEQEQKENLEPKSSTVH